MPVTIDYGERKMARTFKLADRNGARWALILGDDEIAAGEIVVRDLEQRAERRLPLADAAGRVAQAVVEGRCRMHDDEAGATYRRAGRDHARATTSTRCACAIGEREYELVRASRPAAPVAAVPAGGRAVAAPEQPAPRDRRGVHRPTSSASRRRSSASSTRAPSPGAEPFVGVGDRVVPGQVLCILEAMKLMNEITSEFAGVVTRVLPENGQIVSLGDEMFWIEP